MNTDDIKRLRALIADDAHALTFQTFGQYRTALLREIDAMGAAPSPQGDAWQPIETAPKDGTRVLLATPRGRMADGEFHARYGVWSWPYVMVEPTLWRPLPTPPIDAARSTPAKGGE